MPTATTTAAAHGGGGPDALLAGADTAVSCASCHVVGIRGTEAVVRGVDVYLQHSCAICHRSLGLGASQAIGPPLDAIGLRDPDYLRQVLERPGRYFPGTPMPPYSGLFHSPSGDGAAVLRYLRTMRAKPRVSAGPEAAERCASCHAAGAAQDREGRPGRGHDCARIRAEAKAFDCARCHGRAVPSGPGECLYVEGRLAECAACHEVPR